MEEVERELAVLAPRENRPELYRRLAARACLDLAPQESWLLYRYDEHEVCSVDQLAERIGVPSTRLAPLVESLESRNYVRQNPPGSDPELELTPEGRAVIDRLTAARRTASRTSWPAGTRRSIPSSRP